MAAIKNAKIRGLTQIRGRFYYRPAQINGVRLPRVALNTSDLDEAIHAALIIARDASYENRPGLLSFEVRRFFMDREEKNRSRWSIDSDRSVLKKFAEHLGRDLLISSITKSTVEKWLKSLRVEGRSESTILTYLRRLNAFMEWCRKQGSIVRNPCEAIERPRVRATRKQGFLTKEQRNRVITSCGRDDIRLILVLGFHCGLRLNEMIEARVDWIRSWPGGGEIVVQETDTFRPKDREARRVPLNSFVRSYLEGIELPGEGFLIRNDVPRQKDKYRWNPRRPFKRLMKELELDWVGFHTLRHTYATLLVMGGAPIAAVAQWLGDGIEVTFANYCGYMPQEAHIEAGV